MKFSCERCGKKYATAESPAPGKVYKLKCKACGHVIVVKPPLASTPPAATRPSAEVPRPTPAPLPRSTTAVGPPRVSAPATAPLTGAGAPAPYAPEGTTEVSVEAIGTTAITVRRTPSSAPEPEPSRANLAAPAPPAPPPDDEFRPPPGDTGYVDLFADGGESHDGTARPGPEAAAASAADPFSTGAPASPPDDAVADGQDPFASVRAELDAEDAQADLAAPAEPAPFAVPKVPKVLGASASRRPRTAAPARRSCSSASACSS